MPSVEAGGLTMRFELEGPADAPVVVLSHSLGADLTMWEPQAGALARRFRVLRYDTRGHGGTSASAGPCTIAALGRDVLALMDALGVERAHFCGLSMGGMIGIWLGAHARERILSLVLCSTAPRIGTEAAWNARIRSVEQDGMKAVAPAVVERWFTPEYRRRAGDLVARIERRLETTPAAGYAACCAAVRDADLRGELPAIAATTLVVAGTRDPATPPAEVKALASGIAGARYVELEASHLLNLEAEADLTAELLGFLSGSRGD